MTILPELISGQRALRRLTFQPKQRELFQEQLSVLLKAGYPLIYLVSSEEDRAVAQITRSIGQRESGNRRLLIWSATQGLCNEDFKVVEPAAADPRKVVPILEEYPDPAVFILKDFHPFLNDQSSGAPLVIRQLRDVVTAFRRNRKTIVLLSPVLVVPPDLEKELTVLDLDMPGETELIEVLDETIDQVKENPRIRISLSADGREHVVKSLQGLTLAEAENALAKVIVKHGRIDVLDVKDLLSEKEQIIRKSGVLEYFSTEEQFTNIGGLENLKQWLRDRRHSFTDDARQFGLPNPRGLLLVGVPGCGKSLSARAVAAEWQMPLLRFDLGKIFGSLLGQSEANMRRSLKVAESVAPCVLWIDEIEKGLAGSRGSSTDSGVASRVLGTLLTWMEENRKPVFTIATANDIDGLPPELLRKGRFDEIFFIDLPNADERRHILAIQLMQHRRHPDDFDLASHLEATEGFSGAELEQAIVSALHAAFSEGRQTRVTDDHLRSGIKSIVPLSRSMNERISWLRSQSDKWRPASRRVSGEI